MASQQATTVFTKTTLPFFVLLIFFFLNLKSLGKGTVHIYFLPVSAQSLSQLNMRNHLAPAHAQTN